MMGQAEFFNKMLPYAKKVSSRTKMFTSVLLAQWGIESAWGTSDVCKNNNNYAGLKYVSSSIAIGRSPSGYAKYEDIDQFCDDYIRCLNNGYYNKVMASATVEEQCRELGESPWAGGHYIAGGVKGQALINVINSNNLKQYDGAGVVTPPTPALNGVSFADIKNKVDNASPEDLRNMALIGAGVILVIALSNK